MVNIFQVALRENQIQGFEDEYLYQFRLSKSAGR